MVLHANPSNLNGITLEYFIFIFIFLTDSSAYCVTYSDQNKNKTPCS